MENQEATKTEFVDIHELLKQEGITKEQEPVKQESPNDIFEKLTGEVVEPKEVVVPPKQETVVTPPQPNTNIYKEKLLEFISLGLLEDAEITTGEGEEEKSIFLSEIEDLDKDTLELVVAKYKQAKDEELKNKYISLDGLDERTKKYIELKKAGGDPSQLIQEEIQYVNPLSKFNLDDEGHQEHLIRVDLQNQGLRPNVINAMVADMKADLSLDLEAKKIAERINSQFDEYVNAKQKEQLAEIEAEKLNQKEVRKTLANTLKELKLPENVAKVVLDNSTKRDDSGITNTEKLFFEAQKDPLKFAKISLFLNNEEEFEKLLTSPIKTKQNLKTVETLFKINPKTVRQNTEPEKPKGQGAEVFEQLTKQFNI